MKKFLAVFLCLAIFCTCLVCFLFYKDQKTGFLRIHIRANSNSEIDQEVKYKVKESVSEFLTDKVSNLKTANEAMKVVNDNLDGIKEVANQTLIENGFFYGANARLCQEYFPTRSYDGFVLEDGLYDALIVELGSGTGDNWWCVVYPPLCFCKNQKIESLIAKFFKK